MADVTEKDLVTATALMGRPPPDEPLTNLAWTQRRNAIAQALATARSEASGGWVPCEERVPGSPSRQVLVVVRDTTGAYRDVWDSDNANIRTRVTHWRELPAIPGAPHE